MALLTHTGDTRCAHSHARAGRRKAPHRCGYRGWGVGVVGHAGSSLPLGDDGRLAEREGAPRQSSESQPAHPSDGGRSSSKERIRGKQRGGEQGGWTRGQGLGKEKMARRWFSKQLTTNKWRSNAGGGACGRGVQCNGPENRASYRGAPWTLPRRHSGSSPRTCEAHQPKHEYGPGVSPRGGMGSLAKRGAKRAFTP